VTLSEARSRRDLAKALLRDGKDPAAEWRQPIAEEQLPGDTFKEVALEYIERRRRENLAVPTMIKKKWLLEFAYPTLGRMKVIDIKPVHVLRVLQDIEEKGNFETARRVRATIGAVCRYAVITARAENDPTIALKGAIASPRVVSRAAITDPKAFGGLLRAIYSFDGLPTTIAGLKLMAMLFPRPGELRLSLWEEYDFEKAIWVIPAERTKMRREHHVPLPKQAVIILKGLREITGQRHGFRASASTLLNESGKWSEDAIERQLAHIDRNAVRRAYARGAFWEERVRMMAWWANYLDELRSR